MNLFERPNQKKQEKQEQKKSFSKTALTLGLAGLLSVNSPELQAQTSHQEEDKTKKIELAEKEPIVITNKEDSRWIEYKDSLRFAEISREMIKLTQDYPEFFIDEKGDGNFMPRWEEEVPEEKRDEHQKVVDKFYTLFNLLNSNPEGVHPVNGYKNCGSCVHPEDHHNTFDEMKEDEYGKFLYGTDSQIPFYAQPKQNMVLLNPQYIPMTQNPTEVSQTYNSARPIGYKKRNETTGRWEYYYFPEIAEELQSNKISNKFTLLTTNDAKDLFLTPEQEIQKEKEKRKELIKNMEKEKAKYLAFVESLGLDTTDIIRKGPLRLGQEIVPDFREKISADRLDDMGNPVDTYTYVKKGKYFETLTLDPKKPEDLVIIEKLERGYDGYWEEWIPAK